MYVLLFASFVSILRQTVVLLYAVLCNVQYSISSVHDIKINFAKKQFSEQLELFRDFNVISVVYSHY